MEDFNFWIFCYSNTSTFIKTRSHLMSIFLDSTINLSGCDIQVFLPLVFYLKSFCLQSLLCNSLADLKVVVVGGSLITFDIILIVFSTGQMFQEYQYVDEN